MCSLYCALAQFKFVFHTYIAEAHFYDLLGFEEQISGNSACCDSTDVLSSLFLVAHIEVIIEDDENWF